MRGGLVDRGSVAPGRAGSCGTAVRGVTTPHPQAGLARRSRTGRRPRLATYGSPATHGRCRWTTSFNAIGTVLPTVLAYLSQAGPRAVPGSNGRPRAPVAFTTPGRSETEATVTSRPDAAAKEVCHGAAPLRIEVCRRPCRAGPTGAAQEAYRHGLPINNAGAKEERGPDRRTTIHIGSN